MKTSPRIPALAIALITLPGAIPSATAATLPPLPQPVAAQPAANRTQPTEPAPSLRTAASDVPSTKRPLEVDQELSVEQQELVDWAQTRFRQAGLEQPDVDFYFHADTQACDGHVGLYYGASASLHLCRLDKQAILHELSHAWAQHNLTDQGRTAFTTLRGLKGWNDRKLDWADRATEHAAEVIVWALMDRNPLVQWVEITDYGTTQRTWRLLTIDNSDPDQLIEAYELLTGCIPTERVEDDPRLTPRTETTSPEARRSP